jgi:hypothetical protein
MMGEAAGGGRAGGPAMGHKSSWAELRRVEQRPTEKKSRGTAGLREMGRTTKQEDRKEWTIFETKNSNTIQTQV